MDDHAAFRASARALLEESGLRVVGEAATGAEALDLVEDVRPDVVLLDVRLPDMDGIEVAGRLARLDRALVLVLTSTHDAGDFGRRLASANVSGFIRKADLTAAGIAALRDPVR